MTSSTFADQNDKRLDPLFEQLRASEDVEMGSTLTQEIWRIWRQTDNDLADALMAQSTQAMALKEYENALATLNHVVAAAPEYAEGWNTRATLLYLMGDYIASAADVKRTLALEPRHFGAWSGLGLIYLHLGDERAALAAFSKALEWNPHLSGSRHNVEAIKKQLREHAI
ncbi:MAG: tetratricopeptide repeat protein [Acidiferrobacterales bacterium]|nr:tetratricopeptide repeat protein [Acidiferrobacterales bacterium]